MPFSTVRSALVDCCLSRLLVALGILFAGSALDGVAQTTSTPPQAPSGNAAQEVARALDRLDAWLGDNPNGDRWRQYLRTTELRSELQKGIDADPAAVAAATQRFA